MVCATLHSPVGQQRLFDGVDPVRLGRPNALHVARDHQGSLFPGRLHTGDIVRMCTVLARLN